MHSISKQWDYSAIGASFSKGFELKYSSTTRTFLDEMLQAQIMCLLRGTSNLDNLWLHSKKPRETNYYSSEVTNLLNMALRTNKSLTKQTTLQGDTIIWSLESTVVINNTIYKQFECFPCEYLGTLRNLGKNGPYPTICLRKNFSHCNVPRNAIFFDNCWETFHGLLWSVDNPRPNNMFPTVSKCPEEKKVVLLGSRFNHTQRLWWSRCKLVQRY